MVMPDRNDKPPLFGKWSAWYALVLLFLIAQIVLFIYFTKYFS